MFYRNIKDYAPEKFKRLTGVSPESFALMVDALMVDALVTGLPAFGRPPDLCPEDRLLMVLMYWREYRTQEHIGQTYGLAGTTVGRTVRQFEDILIPAVRGYTHQGQAPPPAGEEGPAKALLPSDTVFEVVLVDATGSPCERPKGAKRNSGTITAARRSATPSSRRGSPISALASSSRPPSAKARRMTSRCSSAAGKRSRSALAAVVACLGDSGYQGLDKCCANGQTPRKRSKKHPKKHPLTDEERARDRAMRPRAHRPRAHRL